MNQQCILGGMKKPLFTATKTFKRTSGQKILYRNITIKEHDINGLRWCSFCKPEKRKALYRNVQSQSEISCEKHIEKLNNYDNGSMTMADEMTWGRL